MKRLFIVGFAMIIFITIFLLSGSQESYGWTNDKIKNLEKEIANNRNERNKLQSALTNIQNVRRSLVSAREDLARYIEELDKNLAIIEQNIADLLDLIAIKEDEIVEKTIELENAIAEQEAQYAGMKERVRFSYEQGESYIWEFLIGAESLSEILNRADYLEALSRYDETKLNEFIAISQYVALCKEILEGEKILLDEARKAVEAERDALNQLIEDKGREIEAIRGDIAAQEQAIKEYEAEIAATTEVIKIAEKAAADERARLAAEHRRRFDGGKFEWPVPASRRITDDYGNRIHPILRVPQFHNGIDIAAPTGSNILAAYQGEVVAAEYSPIMGNYIMINHGDSVFTLYMHASVLHVKKGDEVTKGQRIAAVGSTGRSTGPHLHFSVRVAGQFVNPWGYFGTN